MIIDCDGCRTVKQNPWLEGERAGAWTKKRSFVYHKKQPMMIGEDEIVSLCKRNEPESVTTGKAGGLKDCEPLKAVCSTDSLTTIRWSTLLSVAVARQDGLLVLARGYKPHNIFIGTKS
jgi:hypothetical protein